MKKGFSLIEIMIVILLITIASTLMVSNFSMGSEKKQKVSLENLKEFMLKNVEFNENVSCICIDDKSKNCFIIADGNIKGATIIENLFTQTPQVFQFNRELSDYEFEIITVDEMEYEPIFELTIFKDKKHNNLVVNTMNDKVYLFNSISLKPKTFTSTNELQDYLYTKQTEVRDAF